MPLWSSTDPAGRLLLASGRRSIEVIIYPTARNVIRALGAPEAHQQSIRRVTEGLGCRCGMSTLGPVLDQVSELHSDRCRS